MNKKQQETLAIITILTITFIFASPLLQNIKKDNYNDDWYQVSSYYLYARKTVLEYHQFPLWSPYFGGGFPMVGHPEDISFSPLFLFILAFGETIGLKLIAVLIYLLGAGGMYYLTKKELGYSNLGSIFSTLTFVLSSWLPFQLSDGNFHSEPLFFLLPWILYFYIRSLRDKRYIILCSFTLTIILFSGAFVFNYTLLFLFFYAALSSFKSKKKIMLRIDPLKKLTTIVLICILLGAIKIIPTLELIKNHNRCIDDYNTEQTSGCIENYEKTKKYQLDFNSLLKSLSSKKFRNFSTMYVGSVPIIFFALGILFHKRNISKYLILFILFSLFIMGSNFIIDLYKIIWYLPLFHKVNKINKYLAPIILFLFAIIVGKSIPSKSRIKNTKEKSKKGIYALLILLVIFSITNQFLSNISIQKGLFNIEDRTAAPQKEFYQISLKNITNRDHEWVSKNQQDNLKKGIGTINWYSSILLNENAIPRYFLNRNDSIEPNNEYKGEIYFTDEKNKAKIESFSPNKIIINMNISNPDTLIINQNYNINWKTSCGKIIEINGLLGVKMRDKCSRVTIRFLPISFIIGLIISMISLTTISISLVLLNLEKQNHKK